MTFGMKMKRPYLDPKQCFDLWIDTGSVYKVATLLKEQYGIYNPDNGKNTAAGIWQAAWRWALENLVESRAKVSQVWKMNGELLTDKDWYTLVSNNAQYIYGRKKYKQFVQDHPYLTPYMTHGKK